MNRVLCIAAHPDDEALGPGGTLIKHRKKGDEVNIFLFSDGEGAKKNIKKQNPYRLNAAKNWCKETKIKLYKLADFPDQRIDTLPQIEIVTEIEKALKKLSPNIVYIHNPTDINKDHEVISKASLVALRPMRFLESSQK